MIVKICGIKDKETLICCEKNNVNFFGMIFYKKSPRNLDIKKAIELQNISKSLKINGVGVFVNEYLENLKIIQNKLDLKYIQLHGNEDNDYLKKLKEYKVKIIKKISISNQSDLNNILNFKDADYFLFDYKPKKNELPGGNAKKFDWEIIKKLQIDKPWFLSGGINLENIELIKKDICPFGIDLSSGVEKKLGIKDNQTINNFMGILNNA